MSFILLLIGLRLGHCLFYEPDVYLADPIRILFVWEGGLASHGGAIGLACAFLWFAHKTKKSFIWVMSRAAVVIPITAFFVRMGNLMNSEIYGVATTLPWGFVFVRDAMIQTNASELSSIMAQAGLVSDTAVQSLQAFLSNCLPDQAFTFESLCDILQKYKFLNESQLNQFVDACVNAGLLVPNHPTQIYEALTYLTTGGILIAYYQLRVKHNKPIIAKSDKCVGCKSCMRLGCPAISIKNGKAVIDNTLCVGCGVCGQMCHFDALEAVK